MLRQRQTGAARRRGHAVLELTFFIPWVYFLFVGALDFGFYSYALIAVQNAARAAAVNAALFADLADDQAEACRQVRNELSRMPNASSFPSGCSAAPLSVTVTPFVDSQTQLATRVSVTYQTVRLLAIPGLVPAQLNITRTAEVRVFGD